MRKHPMCERFMCDRPMTERHVCDRPMRDHPMCEHPDTLYFVHLTLQNINILF